jgi:chemotaxis protein MotB
VLNFVEMKKKADLYSIWVVKYWCTFDRDPFPLPPGNMSRLVNNWLLIRNKVIYLMVIGFIFPISGCRSLSSKSPLVRQPVPAQSDAVLPASPQPVPEKSPPPQSLPIPSTSYRPPTFLELENQSKSVTEKTMMFRSIVPEHFIVKREVLPSPSEPISGVSSQSVPESTVANITPNTSADVDILNRRVAELEKALAASEKKSEQEKQPIIVSNVSKPIVPQVQSPSWVPSINHSGVTVLSDGERVRILIIDQVLFQSGTWRLNPDAEELLRKIVGEIRANVPNALLEIEGHTDGIMNTDPANTTQKHDISSAKTMVIMDYFVNSLRWNVTKIKTSNFGSSHSVADNSTPEGRIRNNRIEIVVLPKEQ